MTTTQTQAEVIAAAAERIAAEWPPLAEEQRAELSRIFAPFAIQPAKPARTLRRAA